MEIGRGRIGESLLPRGGKHRRTLDTTPFGGLAVWSSYESEVRYISVKDLQGRTLYEGKLFPQTVPGVPGDPNKYQWGIVGGDGEKLIVNLHSFSEQGITSYMLSLDLRDNLKPTVLWSNEC